MVSPGLRNVKLHSSEYLHKRSNENNILIFSPQNEIKTATLTRLQATTGANAIISWPV